MTRLLIYTCFMASLFAASPVFADWPFDSPFIQSEEGWFFYRDPQLSFPDPMSDWPQEITPQSQEPLLPFLRPPVSQEDDDAQHTTSPDLDPPVAQHTEPSPALQAIPMTGPALESWLLGTSDTDMERLTNTASASSLRTWIPLLLDQALTTLDRSSVRKYLLVQRESLRRSDRFTKLWQEVVWTDPTFDRPGAMPTGTLAQDIYESDRRQRQEVAVSALQDQLTLLLIVKPDCRHCEAQWNVLHAFQNTHGIIAKPISEGLMTLADSTLAMPYPQIIKTLQPNEIPALYALVPATGQVIRLGSGILAQDEILTRLLLLIPQELQKGASQHASTAGNN